MLSQANNPRKCTTTFVYFSQNRAKKHGSGMTAVPVFSQFYLGLPLLHLKADFAVDPVLGDLAVLDRGARFINVYRLDPPYALGSFVQGVLSGVFPALCGTSHDFYYLDYHTTVVKILVGLLYFLHKIAYLLDKINFKQSKQSFISHFPKKLKRLGLVNPLNDEYFPKRASHTGHSTP